MSLNLARALNSTANIITIMAWDTVAKKLKTGLTSATSGLTVYSGLNGAAPSSIGTLTTMTEGTFTSLGFVEMANMPGFYQVGVPNAKFSSAVGELFVGARITSDDTIVFSAACIPILPASAYATSVDANVVSVEGKTEIERGLGLLASMRLLLAKVVGLTTGGGSTSEVYKSARNDGTPGKTRITETNDGTNRTARTFDVTDD